MDLDRATARELERLPGIGPGLAARIVADREAHGPFGGLAGFDRVAGVGPALLTRVAPHAAFSGVAAVEGGGALGAGTDVHLRPGETLLNGAPTPLPAPRRTRAARAAHPRSGH